MNISINKTDCKLTKSLVNQMRIADRDLKGYKALGHVVKVVKDAHIVALLEKDGNYRYLPLTFTKSTQSVYRKIGRWSSAIQFDTEEDCTQWWLNYLRIKADAMAVQIYI